MKVNRKGVYAGTFDPITNGHLWMIERGAKLFHPLIVAIGVNPDKQPLFSLEERLVMIRESTKHLRHIIVTAFPHEYLADYAREANAQFVLRGLRNLEDFEVELKWLQFNRKRNPKITSVFLMPPHEISWISSSVVKGLIGPKRWQSGIKDLVPPAVFERIKEVYRARTKRGNAPPLDPTVAKD